MRRDSKLVRLFHRLINRFILPGLVKWGLTPARLTVGGLILSALAGTAYLVSPVWAGIMAALSGLCDALDGLLARHTGRAGQRGAFLDSVLDRYGETFLFMGMWGCFVRTERFAILGTLAVFLAVMGAYMVSYTRARGEGLSVFFDGGHFTRDERLLIIIAGSLADPLAPGLVLFLTVTLLAVGANISALYRFRTIIGRLSPPPRSVPTPAPKRPAPFQPVSRSAPNNPKEGYP